MINRPHGKLSGLRHNAGRRPAQDLTITVKELLLQELEDAAEPLIVEVLDFLRYLKFRQLEDEADIADA